MHTTQTDQVTGTLRDAKTAKLLVLWGVTVWFAVAVLIRLVGHIFLSPENPLLVFGFFLSVIPLMIAVTYPVYNRLDISVGSRATAAALMSIPGLFLDVLLVLYAEIIFPQMEIAAVINYAAILLFGYAIVLVTGFVPRKSTSETQK